MFNTPFSAYSNNNNILAIDVVNTDVNKKVSQPISIPTPSNNDLSPHCCICDISESSYMISTPCKHNICMTCLTQMQTDSCPMCRTSFDDLPDSIKMVMPVYNNHINVQPAYISSDDDDTYSTIIGSITNIQSSPPILQSIQLSEHELTPTPNDSESEQTTSESEPNNIQPTLRGGRGRRRNRS